jgi:hypothetical protein
MPGVSLTLHCNTRRSEDVSVTNAVLIERPPQINIIAIVSQNSQLISYLLVQVEVQGENSAYYRAHVVDVFDNEVLLRFEDDWQPPSR